MSSIICKADEHANFAICPMAVELSLTFICRATLSVSTRFFGPGQRQRRADRFLAAISCLDARERRQ
jgi:hypothetical protein